VSDGTASGRSVICDVGTLATGLEKEGCAEAWIFTDFNSVKAFAYSVSQCEIEMQQLVWFLAKNLCFEN
jgi:hypothetical protein